MASDAPVVAADAMTLPHLVRPGRNGWLDTPGDVAGLTARLARLLADEALRRRMGHASRAIAAEHAIGATLDTFETSTGSWQTADASKSATPPDRHWTS